MDPNGNDRGFGPNDLTSDDTWHAVDRLFAGALERPPSERRAWLEDSTPNPELVPRVLRLLEVAEDSHLPLDSGDDAWLRSLWNDLVQPAGEDPLLGTHVSSYRLVRRLGSGGMGTVYLGEREGGEFEHRVAIKLLKPGVETAESLGRFRLERRILASLDHPAIARLFDGGTTPDGRPYIVMEYVEGERITHHVEATGAGLEGVLEPFLTAADAVEHAHRHLVVHRDLKPSNILVRRDGVVKLLDFGIARLLSDEAPDRTVAGSRVMTPTYAAPEQYRGGSVTTATDVYQLGAVLHELLTGTPVFGKSVDPREMERRVLEEAPPRPSAVLRGTTPGSPGFSRVTGDAAGQRAGWERRVRGDLDTIVLKALRKEPERRYGSAGALAEDVRRYLERRPVAARPDTLGYRVRTTLRRHRWLAPAAAVVLVALTAYVGTLVRYNRSLERERAVAEQVERFLIDLFEPADPRRSDGETVTARELLEAGADRVERELAGQPELQVRLARVMGEAFAALSDHDGARRVYELRLARVRETAEAESEDHASALADLGVVRGNAGDFHVGDSLLTEALAIRRRMHGPQHELVGQTLIRRAALRSMSGDLEGADEDFRTWLPIFRRSPPEPTPEYLSAMGSLYWMRVAQGRTGEAIQVASDALALARSGFPDSNPLVAQYQGLVANAHFQQEQYAETIEVGSRALATLEAAAGPEGSWEIIAVLTDLGMAYEHQERLDTAAALFRRTIDLHTRFSGPGNASLIQPNAGLARIRSAQGRHAEAREAQARALEIADASMGGPNPFSGSLRIGLGEIVEADGDTAAARELYRTGVEQLGPSRFWRPAYVTGRRRLAALDRGEGSLEAAERHLTAALDALDAMETPDPGLQRVVLEDLVDLFEAWPRPGRAGRTAELRRRLEELAGQGS